LTPHPDYDIKQLDPNREEETMSDPRKSKTPVVIIVAVVIIGLALALYFGLKQSSVQNAGPTPASDTETAANGTGQKLSVPITPKTVLDYDSLEKNSSLQDQMARRKSELGLDSSVDMVVKADESFKVGNRTIPMREILDKIRLKKGEIIENDMTPSGQSTPKPLSHAALMEKLAAAEKQYLQIGEQLKNPQVINNKELHARLQEQYKKMEAGVSGYRKYKELDQQIRDLKHQTENGSLNKDAATLDRLSALEEDKKVLEDALRAQISPDDEFEAYGIYVVKPSDNVWNIHFEFLREYFENRDIAVTSTADEPNTRGRSSGIGRILKFSENMVYIYNTRERMLEMDLDVIQPLTKIVIFNMGEVLNILGQIDFRQIDQIRYDGDTLWVPAKG
jgi:PCRF domain